MTTEMKAEETPSVPPSDVLDDLLGDVYPYPPHPAADMFAPVEGTEFDDLVKDIEMNGQIEPIILYTDENAKTWILDGRNRARALRKLGKEPAYRHWAGECGSPTAFVMSLNLFRRHLTATQRASLGADLLPMIQAEAKVRQRMAAKQTNEKKKATHTPPADVPEASAPLDPNTKGDARDIAGTLVGASGRNVSAAAKIKAQAPDVFEGMKSGKVESIPQAEALSKLPPEVRQAAIARNDRPTKPQPTADEKYEADLKKAVTNARAVAKYLNECPTDDEPADWATLIANMQVVVEGLERFQKREMATIAKRKAATPPEPK